MSILIKIAETHEKLGKIFREMDAVMDTEGNDEKIEELGDLSVLHMLKLKSLYEQLD